MKFTWSRQAAQVYSLLFAPGTKAKGLGRDKIHAGGSSGYMAVGLAYLLGAAEIYLLGFDMQMTDGKSHFFGDHKKTSNPTSDMLSKWVICFDEIHADLDALGIPLINCTRQTALNIPKMALEDALNAPKPC